MSQLNYIKAQNLFNVPDTVCIRQPVTITSNIDASTYYWGFCSGYLLNAPVGTNMGLDTTLNNPNAIIIEKEGANYYGFVANETDNSLVRLSFGTSLGNTPSRTIIGDLNNTMPEGPTKMFLTKDANGDWFMFVTGGTDLSNSSLARVDFGKSLANTPNSVNFGNLGGVLSGPRGIFVQQVGNNYLGYLVNNFDNKLIRLTFGNNISLTPVITDMGSGFGLSGATDMLPVFDNGRWYAFAVNAGNNALSRLDFGFSLNNSPVGNTIAIGGNPMKSPSSLNFVRDCDNIHLFVTNEIGNSITRIDVPSIQLGPYFGIEYVNVGALNTPMSITKLVRERDNLYAYVVNNADNTITMVSFPQCTSATIASATTNIPPVYSYSQPGRHNVYLAVDEGLPTMRVQCKQIDVLPIPPLTMSQDTIICQGDTLTLSIRSQTGLSFNWRPDYNLGIKTDSFDVRVWPDFATDYRVVVPYANGCIVDTGVFVDVSKNKADAGPDRILGDGAKTILGGPMTTESTEHTYTWLPTQFISDISITNPVVNPPYDYTYYLEVRNSFGCYDIDTVVVRVTCNDLNLPNAFAPESSNPNSNRFGVMNRQIVKLNYLKVFDRWGKLVFETTDVTRQWDGKVNGEPAPFGVYVWEADGFCLENKRFKRSGNVTLIR
ncbi:MAG TPA: gliding motility-associated C-terminal domain-containing protein [Flavipsychrobacter sp.]|nr:gliding motility-associated C-terminal domain-containing protein [Flavipsychrobacter sp.]